MFYEGIVEIMVLQCVVEASQCLYMDLLFCG